jgi:serine/threonine protein kinase
MAPEVLRLGAGGGQGGRAGADGAAGGGAGVDLWSLGVITYELLDEMMDHGYP